MEKTVKRVESQVQFWTLIGPILTVLTMMVVLIKGDSKQWPLSLVAISGIPLCWKWQKQGFYVAAGALLLLCTYQMMTSSIEERFWVIGLSLTICAAFVVTVLSLQESTEMIKALELESKSRLDNLFQLDGKFKEAQVVYQKELELLTAKVKRLQTEAEERLQQAAAFEKLIAVAKRDLLEADQNRQKMVQEVFDRRHENTQLHQRLEELQRQHLAAEVARKEEIAAFKLQLESSQQHISSLQKRSESYIQEIRVLKDLNETQTKAALHAQEEQILHQAIVQEMNDHVERLSREKELLERTLVRLQAELESQFNHIASLKLSAEKLQKSAEDEKDQHLAQCRELQGQLNAIAKDKEAIFQELEEKRTQLQTPPQKYSHTLPFTVHDERSVAKAVAMYNQLRHQFEEKSGVLDTTRKELFHTQEKLLQLQKDVDEARLYEISENEAKLQASLLSMEKDLLHKDQEVQALHDLISSLICSK